MSSSDGKLLATAMGAATAGAALAVIAMRMIESSNQNHNHNHNNPNGIKGSGGNESTNKLLAYHTDENRPIRPSVIMNDPSDLVGDGSSSSIGAIGGAIKRESSEAMLFPHNHEAKMRRRIATRYTIEEENNLRRDSVTVRVPATSANVGPGCKRNAKYHWIYCGVLLCFLRVAHAIVSLSFFHSDATSCNKSTHLIG